MFSDAAALAIALTAIRIGKRPAGCARTFGYYRMRLPSAGKDASLNLKGAYLEVRSESSDR